MTVAISNESNLFLQRRAEDGLRDITLSGPFALSGLVVEWNGSTAAASVAEDGSWSATLADQSPGEGRVEFRLGQRRVEGPYVLVGDVFVVSGQSNAYGETVVDNVQTATSGGARFLKWNGDWLVEGDAWVSASEASVWPRVMHHLREDGASVPVAFVKRAIDGKPIASWLNNNNAGYRAVRDGLLESAGYADFAAYQAAGSPDVAKSFLWWQGTNDATLGTTQADYETRLRTLAGLMAGDIGIGLMPALLHDITVSDETAVRAATSAAITADSNVLPGPDLGSLTATDGRHLETDNDIDAAAQLWAAAIFSELYA